MTHGAEVLLRRSLDELVAHAEALDGVTAGDPEAQLAPLLLAACQLQLDLQLTAHTRGDGAPVALAAVRELCTTLCRVQPGRHRATRHARGLVARIVRLLEPNDAAA